MSLRRLVLAFGVAAAAASALEYTDNGIAIVGTTEALDVVVTAGTSRQDVISHEFASYIAVHFAGFNLPDGDSVVIASPDDNVTVSHTYTGLGRDQRGTFIASFVPGNSVTVTYKSVGDATAGQGYRITGYSRGYPTMRQESICGDGDQSLPAKCYAPGSNLSEELPHAYGKAQAVARLLINGTYLCTGWLGGSEGHLFTNHHCFEEEDWALTTDFEFAAESSSCSDQCETQLGCPGTLVATTSTFIADSDDSDYSVVQLPDCVDLSPYGYLQLRESGPVLNESIYVPQHPDGYAKRIVSTVDDGDDTTIRSVGEDGDCGNDQVGHDADTQGGSSGSPLVANSDNLVVAIHHCGGCTNTAIDVRTVLADLASKNVTIENLVASEDAGQSGPPLYAQTPCTSQSPKNSTAGRNSTMPCRHLTAQGSSKLALSTTTNSTAKVTSAPPPAATSFSISPLATVTASKGSSPASTTTAGSVTKTTSSSTTTTSTTAAKTSTSAALTSASVVTMKGGKKTTLSPPTAASTLTSSSTTASNSTLSTASTTSTSTATKMTSVKSAAMADCDSTPSPPTTASSSTSIVDNDTLVSQLKTALTGSSSDTSPVSTPTATSPGSTLTTATVSTLTSTPKPTALAPTPASMVTSTPKPTTPTPTPALTVTTTPKPTTPTPTPASSVTSTPKPTTPTPTPALTVTTTPKPTTPTPTPASSVTSTPKPTTPPTPALTVTTTPKPTTPTPTPASSVTSTPKPTTPTPTPALTVTTTPKPTTPTPTPASSVTSTPKPTTTSSSTPALTVTTTPKPPTPTPTHAATSLTSSSTGSEDVEQN
uniref:Serine protease n=1 Tax=Phytophthora ramorum TaxID=164328 RepID=H3GTC4_PHYRM